MTPPTLSTRALNRSLLARQHLLARTAMPPLAMVEHLVALQGQNPHDPYLALWSRVDEFAAADLSDALAAGRVVRIGLLRTTLHLATAADARSLWPLVRPVLARSWSHSPFRKDLPGIEVADILDAARPMLAETLTLAELGRRLEERWPGRSAASLSYVARFLLPIVQVPPRGLWGRSGQARWRPLDSWLGTTGSEQPDGATVADLVLRYLAAFGPATPADLATWSWLTGFREILEDLRPGLRTFRDETGRELFDLPDAPLPHPDTPAPFRFLPEYDNVALSHADRSRIVAPETVGRITGYVGTLLVDGFVAGQWRIRRDGDGATLVLDPFTTMTAAQHDEAIAEGEALLAFREPSAPTREVVFGVARASRAPPAAASPGYPAVTSTVLPSGSTTIVNRGALMHRTVPVVARSANPRRYPPRMTDVWVCTNCKSINRERDSRCYSCGQRKEQVAAAEGPNVRLEAALANRSVNAYHSSLPFAIVAGVLVSIVALMGVYLVFEAVQTLDELRAAFLAAIASNDRALVDRVLAEQRQASTISVLHFPLTIVAVLAFGAWLSRVCLNIPVLGGGTPTWTPVKALVYPIIPIVNFIKVPGMVQDAMYRLDPKAGGFFLVFAAFIGLVGSWLVALFGSFAITANAVGRVAGNPTRDGLVAAFSDVLDQTFALSVATELMTAVGALLLVVIIARVESRAAARDREIQAVVFGEGGPDAAPAQPGQDAAVATLEVAAPEGQPGTAYEPHRSVPVYRPQATAGPDPITQPAPASDDEGPLLPPPPPA